MTEKPAPEDQSARDQQLRAEIGEGRESQGAADTGLISIPGESAHLLDLLCCSEKSAAHFPLPWEMVLLEPLEVMECFLLWEVTAGHGFSKSREQCLSQELLNEAKWP